METFSEKTEQGVTTKVIISALNYLKEYKGEGEVEKFISHIALTREYIFEENNWVSFDTYIKAMNYIKEVFKDENIGFKIGLYSFANLKNFGMVALIVKALSTPDMVFKRLAGIANKSVKFGQYRVLEFSKNRLLLEFKNKEGYPFHQINCDYRIGLFSGIPQIYGLQPAKYKQIKCQGNGDDACVYEFIWHRQPLIYFGKSARTGLLIGIVTAIILHFFLKDYNLIFPYLFDLIITILFYVIGIARDVATTSQDNIRVNQEETKALEEALEFANKKYEEARLLIQKLETLTKASETINSNLSSEKLIEKILDVITKVIGYDRAMIMLVNKESDELFFAGASGATEEMLKGADQIKYSLETPTSLHAQVAKFSNPVLVDNIDNYPGVSDLRLAKISNSSSFIIVPLKIENKVIGTLSVDRYYSKTKLTENDKNLLSNLANQIAIALLNADLYKNLENKVIERTQQLEKLNSALKEAYDDLKKTQIQLAQSEKMASLGQLVAGVAHEINNPVAYIYSNIKHLGGYVKRFKSLLNEYESLASITEEEKSKILNLKSNIDYDFLINDVDSLLNSCDIGIQRVKNIVNDLRNFSRLDEAELKEVDIHEGIDSTLVLFLPQYENKLTVHKEYGDIPKIHCYAGQLNQVFMNLLVNSAQAIEERNKLEDRNRGNIWIKTEVVEDNKIPELQNSKIVRISIKDDGNGIPVNIRDKIFDPFFTTKPIGKGTGLGLSISYSIIEKHKGKLFFNTEVEKGTEFLIELPIKGPEKD
jgi:signal transduction histidine kinase